MIIDGNNLLVNKYKLLLSYFIWYTIIILSFSYNLYFNYPWYLSNKNYMYTVYFII